MTPLNFIWLNIFCCDIFFRKCINFRGSYHTVFYTWTIPLAAPPTLWGIADALRPAILCCRVVAASDSLLSSHVTRHRACGPWVPLGPLSVYRYHRPWFCEQNWWVRFHLNAYIKELTCIAIDDQLTATLCNSQLVNVLPWLIKKRIYIHLGNFEASTVIYRCEANIECSIIFCGPYAS